MASPAPLPDGQHDAYWPDMWQNDPNADPHPWLKFSLGGPYVLDRMHVWNHNVQGNSFTGIRTADIWISMSGGGTPDTDPDAWTRIADDMLFQQAPGAVGYNRANSTIWTRAGCSDPMCCSTT